MRHNDYLHLRAPFHWCSYQLHLTPDKFSVCTAEAILLCHCIVRSTARTATFSNNKVLGLLVYSVHLEVRYTSIVRPHVFYGCFLHDLEWPYKAGSNILHVQCTYFLCKTASLWGDEGKNKKYFWL